MEKLIDISSYPVAQVLDVLLQDKTTKKNIIWATDTYAEFGEEFTDKVQLDANAILRRTDLIRPRIQKSQEAQAQRTRKKAEVFTPAWLCNQMNNHCDEDWFGRSGVFNTENSDHTWTVSEGKIEFPPKKKWQHYVDSRRLELVGGEYSPADVLATVGLRGPVDYTVVAGKIVVKDGRLVTIDEERVSADARKCCRAYLAKV